MNLSEKLPNDAKRAIVILLKMESGGIRYFSKFGKKRIVNAWSLAGAKLFLLDSPELSLIESELNRRGFDFVTQFVGLI